MNIYDRPLAFTDVETTGLDPLVHEIIEIGVVLVNQKSLAPFGELELKIQPQRLEIADPTALKINGYNQADWKNAKSLLGAMQLFGEITKDAIFVAHNVTFDWSFIREAFRAVYYLTGSLVNKMDHHRIDLFTLAWAKLGQAGPESYNLKRLAEFVGIPPEPEPHRALQGALTAYDIYRELMRRY